MTFIYRFDSEIQPVTPLRLKVEVNTRKYFTVYGANKLRGNRCGEGVWLKLVLTCRPPVG